MTTQQLAALAQSADLPGGGPAELLETHISWVLLTPHFAYKVKKPVAFAFLDFSTLEKRRFFCEEELRLNRRLAPDLYLDVCPVTAENGRFTIREPGTYGAEPADYALRMRRLDNTRRMDALLVHGDVSTAHVETLAGVLVPFHRRHVLPPAEPYDPGAVWADFADLFTLENDVRRWLGDANARQLLALQRPAERFYDRHRARLAARHRAGFRVEGHGDLHARNIFLLETGPVVFDCIEFSEHLRQLDVLSELAFLAMDLDFFQRPDLGRAFIVAYRRTWEIMPEAGDAQLLEFFKAYRANVRLKVTLLGLRQHVTDEGKALVRRYADLMLGYRLR